MVTTGVETRKTRKTEILDLVSGESCLDLARLGKQMTGGMGANLNGTPVVCGGHSSGYGYGETCYKFKDSIWHAFINMREKRYQAAGVVYNNMFHVFGGTFFLLLSRCIFRIFVF